jgi:adenosylcobinamide-GDP ribazoletransferase
MRTPETKEYKMLREIRNLVAFLTIFPVGMTEDCLLVAAKYMYLFPLVGAFIGLLAGTFAWLLLQVFPTIIVGTLTLGFILLITGLHHADGLLDFGDGLMFQGSPEQKIRVMQDQQTGVGGMALGIITLLTTAFTIAALKTDSIVQGLIATETSAKLAMVFVAWIGKSAHKGMATYFIDKMHGPRGNLRFLTATMIASALSVLAMNMTGLIVISVGVTTALLVISVSNRHFHGVTGDVIGATNELARMTSLLTILLVVGWA